MATNETYCEEPYCEECGEAHATLQTAECAVCDDCFAVILRAELVKVLGRAVCGRPVYYTDARLLNVCLEPYGTPHDHCA